MHSNTVIVLQLHKKQRQGDKNKKKEERERERERRLKERKKQNEMKERKGLDIVISPLEDIAHTEYRRKRKYAGITHFEATDDKESYAM